MSEPKTLNPGDPCPSCSGTFKPAKAPTPEQYAAATRREEPVFLPAGTDTASPDFIAEHGLLHRCPDCGYQTRFPVDTADAKKTSKASAK